MERNKMASLRYILYRSSEVMGAHSRLCHTKSNLPRARGHRPKWMNRPTVGALALTLTVNRLLRWVSGPTSPMCLCRILLAAYKRW